MEAGRRFVAADASERVAAPTLVTASAPLAAPVSVAAVVVTFESAAVLPACLGALRAENVPAIVVDNASRDGSAALARDLGATVIANARNEGYGRANGIGAEAARAEWLLVVNPDIVLHRGSVERLMEAAGRYPEAGLLAPRIAEASGRLFFQPRSLLSPYLPNPAGRLALPEGDSCAPFLSGACLLIRRNLFLSLGGFDPAIFLFYEDDDLCRRIADTGRALVHVHGAVARHGRGRSSAPAAGRIFATRWHQAWSRAYVSRKYGLADPARRMAAVNGLKALLAMLSFRRSLVERYAGSAAGALAFLLGRTALGRQGLDPEPPGAREFNRPSRPPGSAVRP